MGTSDAAIAAFSGEIDFTMRDGLRAKLATLADAATAIVDLSHVSYMDSSAIAEIIFLQRDRIRRGRAAPAVVIGPGVTRLFEAAGLRGAIPLFASLDEAKIAE